MLVHRAKSPRPQPLTLRLEVFRVLLGRIVARGPRLPVGVLDVAVTRNGEINDSRSMLKESRLLSGSLLLVISVILAGCPGEYGGGYDKVPNRERTPVALAAAPDPPPFVAGVGAGAVAATPILAAGAAPAGVTQEMVEDGQQLYGTVCGACHGPGAVGTPAGPGLNDQNWLHISGSYDEIVAIVQNGVASPIQYPAAMPPLGGGNFSTEQVRAISAYILALSLRPDA